MESTTTVSRRAKQRAQRPQVGLVAGREDQDGLGAQPVGELLFELQVKACGPVQEPGTGDTRPVARAAPRARPA